MDPAKISEPNVGYLWSCLSVAIFFLTSFLLRFVLPESVKQSENQKWKWRNTANSLLHSCITGIWSCMCFWKTPEIRSDLISTYTVSGHGALSLSAGYFAYDLLDMLFNHRKRSSYELMLHHVLVILCFGVTITTRYYVGYGLVALLVEVNSVFLHIRQLMLIQNVNKNRRLYRVNSFLNIGTFLVFRIVTLGWMMCWLILRKDDVTPTSFAIGIISLPIIILMNVVLFVRVLNSDYFHKCSADSNLNLIIDENEDWTDEAKPKTK